MEFKIYEVDHNGLHFKIEEDLPEVGVYLHVFKDGKCIKDYLQNDIETCMELAYVEYNVPLEKWNLK